MKRAAQRQRERRPSNDDSLRQGMIYQQAGRLEEAERCYRAVARRHPDYPDALHLRGTLAHQRGDYERARDLIRKAIQLRPNQAPFHYNLGEVYRMSGRFEPAIEQYRRALKLDPDSPDISFNMGNALLALERYREAITAYRRALSQAPEDAELHNNLGNALAATGEEEASLSHYREAVRVDPHYFDAQINIARALQTQGRHGEAIARFKTLLKSLPGRLDLAEPLCRLLYERGEIEQARQAAAAFLPHLGQAPGDCCAFAATLGKLGMQAEARLVYENVLACEPDNALACAGLGFLLQRSGDFSQANAWHEKAVRLHPGYGDVWLALVKRRPGLTEPRDIQAMTAALKDKHLTIESRANMHFALARAAETAGDAAVAFSHYREGNRLKADELAFDPQHFRERCAEMAGFFNREFFASRTWSGVDSDIPVFVVGMPRSGTSLVEQIIASHPRAFGAGELKDVSTAVRELRGELGRAFPDCVNDLTAEYANDFARRYLDGLSVRAAGAERVTDKMPFNGMWLGLIALLLPGARIIDCRRDPMDTCLSCYFQSFAEGLRFSYDLDHLGVVYRQYERLMEHWHEVLPLPMLRVQYEDVVADPQTQARRLIDFIGLPWDERCLRFHQTRREVNTASFWQVRQPLYNTSVGRWRAYEEYLMPLVKALEKD